MSYPTELTPAQQAAAEFLRDIHAARQGLPAEITPGIRAEARAVVAAVRPHLATEPPVHDDIHHYLSTGCLHGEMTLPDGRTGHQYCQGMTGMAGMKRGGRCKFCDALCRCGCHKSVAEQCNSCDQED